MQETKTSKTYLLILLRQNFAPPEKILENTGLCLTHLESIKTVKYETTLQVIRNLNQYSKDSIWPTTLGTQFSYNSHGTVSFAALSADTLGQAIMTFLDWGQIRFPSNTNEIVKTANSVDILIHDTLGEPVFHKASFQMFARGLETLFPAITQQPCRGMTEIHFADPYLNEQQALRNAFESQLFFAAPTDKITIPTHWWNMASPLSDPEAHFLNLKKCEQLLFEQSYSTSPSAIIKTLLRQHFESNISGLSESTPPPTLVNLAEKMHMSERTLIRRLKNIDTSYKKILEDTRKEIATRLLEQARYSIADISDLLGYHSAANFCRAFNKWFGKSPSQFRREC